MFSKIVRSQNKNACIGKILPDHRTTHPCDAWSSTGLVSISLPTKFHLQEATRKFQRKNMIEKNNLDEYGILCQRVHLAWHDIMCCEGRKRNSMNDSANSVEAIHSNRQFTVLILQLMTLPQGAMFWTQGWQVGHAPWLRAWPMYPQPPVVGWSRVGLKIFWKTRKIDMSCNSEQVTRLPWSNMCSTCLTFKLMLDIQAGASARLLHAMDIPHNNRRFKSFTFGLLTSFSSWWPSHGLQCFGNRVGKSVTRLPLLQRTGFAHRCKPKFQAAILVALAAAIGKIFDLKSGRVIGNIWFRRNTGYPRVATAGSCTCKVSIQDWQDILARRMTSNENITRCIIVCMNHDIAWGNKSFPPNHCTKDRKEFTFENDCLPFAHIDLFNQDRVQLFRDELQLVPTVVHEDSSNASEGSICLGLKWCICENVGASLWHSQHLLWTGAGKHRFEFVKSMDGCCAQATCLRGVRVLRHQSKIRPRNSSVNLACRELYPTSQAQSTMPFQNLALQYIFNGLSQLTLSAFSVINCTHTIVQHAHIKADTQSRQGWRKRWVLVVPFSESPSK